MHQIQGKSEGEFRVFKHDGGARAYMWKVENGVGKWEFFDDVALPDGGGGIGQPNNHYPGDRMFPAGEYDRIFDVEADDGIT